MTRVSTLGRAVVGAGLVALAGCSLSGTSCEAPPEGTGEPGPGGHALRFCGTGENDVDRVKIVVDDPLTEEGSPPVDVGATDFTIEWWMKATADGNPRAAVECGENLNWINGNILIDRDRFNQGRKYGVSVAGGVVVFGVSGRDDEHRTVCGRTDVLDERWHHVAVQRRRADGRMWLFVDGQLEATAVGPVGDVSYPDDGVPLDFCWGLCLNSDPYLVLGAEKHDAGAAYPPYTGWMDEMRISTILRYTDDFPVPDEPFAADPATVALWHFDEGEGHVLIDSSSNGSHGLIHRGGPHDAPRWGVSDAPLR